VVATWIANLVALGVPADKWRPGGVFSTILRISAATYAGFTTIMAAAVGAAFLPTAKGGWLTLLAFYVFNVSRREATFASGQETLTNSGGGVFTYGPNEVTFLDSTTKKTYTNVAGFTLGAGAPGNPTLLTIDIRATEAGAASSAPPGEIDRLQTSMLGVTVSNALSVVGIDAESDDELRAACVSKLGSLSVRGPPTAYRWAVRIAVNSSGNPVNINRMQVSPDSHTGDVTVTLAAPQGAPTRDDVAAAAASIEQNARPDGVTVTVNGAIPIPYAPSLVVWATALPGLDAATVHNAVTSSLATFLALYPLGGITTSGGRRGLFASGIAGVAKAAHSSVFAVDGAIDLPLVAGEVATNAISVAVNLVAVAAAA
jgi:phage-related baseplate assembly protein